MASKSSVEPRANKRPRLSDESSNESSGPSVETNLTLHWDPIAVAATQTASQTFPTLDTSGNPMLNLCNNGIDRLIATSPPVRNLDWRRGSRGHLTSERKRRAALGQRSDGLNRALFGGACMNCSVVNPAKCSFRGPDVPEWHIQWIRANDMSLQRQPHTVDQVTGPASVSAHTGVPSSVDEVLAPSTSTQSKQHGPMYSAKWYRTPLDDGSLAKDINGMIAVREDLREVRTRVAYDIKKLSKFTGDGGSEEEETLENDEPNPFYKSGSELGDDDTGSAHAGSENDGSEVGSLGVGSVDLDSDVVDSVVGSNDVASVVDSNDVDVGDVGDVDDDDDDDDE
ncbi:hypothetical protein LT330_002660 [Penicillium expansum]|nr:hypothetical protein LT330_002660 [Penicillium expansum]